MEPSGINPFEVTKAVDFSDEEIEAYWVDIAGGSGFSQLIKPTSPVPMIILGGKGSGKTHLLRYFSYALQKLRHGDHLLEGLLEEGYVGVYLLSSSLNASRFSKRGVDEDKWAAVFAFYMDLWLSQLLLDAVADVYEGNKEFLENESEIFAEASKLIKSHTPFRAESLRSFSELLINERRLLDVAINNLPFTGDLNINIISSPGELLFGLPAILYERLPSFRRIGCVYLVDEIENLEPYQQKYLNTLVRERRRPVSFKIGARLYGVKTYSTFVDGEENKEGSEFEVLRLDHQLREDDSGYRAFALKLLARRLRQTGVITEEVEGRIISREAAINDWIEDLPTSFLEENQTRFVRTTYPDGNPPYFRRLRAQLEEQAKRLSPIPPRIDAKDIDLLISNLQCPAYPLVEKANVFLLYRAWSDRLDLVAASRTIAAETVEFIERGGRGGTHETVLDKFKADLLAQLMRECNKSQLYVGFDTLVDMSHGLPRNLLVLLKCAYKWSVFGGEKPFSSGPISIASQQRAVLEASEWFFRDARMSGRSGALVHAAIARLGELFRRIRYSDKPSECSLTSFSVNLNEVSAETRKIIELAENWSFLISVQGGTPDRNSMRVDAKYQLNRMLSPRWDLPLYRRGTIALSGKEANAIFDPASSAEFESVLGIRLSRMNAPFSAGITESQPSQPALPGLFDNA